MNDHRPEPPRASTELIRNCRFAFRCTQQWDTLSATQNPRQRYCGECERHVVLCESDDELRAALRRNDCVAFPASLLQFRMESDEAIPYMVGAVMPSYGDRGARTGTAYRLIDGDREDGKNSET
jgi:hypothetical protein